MRHYVMKLAEAEPGSDVEYLRSNTDKTCTTTGCSLEEWTCLKLKMEHGMAFQDAELNCVTCPIDRCLLYSITYLIFKELLLKIN